MACHPVAADETEEQPHMAERIKIAVAALIALGGLFAFYWFGDRASTLRLGILLGAFAVAVVIMWFTIAGKAFFAFSRESWEEAKRVVWPSRKETLQTTGVVFLFVFLMALFLWGVDASLLWVTEKLLGTGG
ncbi:MAG: preprotein translocase subunit SecE [Candidatus Eiseniibacteriota bacterium]